MSPRPTEAALKEQAIVRTRVLIDEAARRLGLKLPQPEIRFDLRGRAAGQARFGPAGPWSIRYNAALLAANPQAFLDETLPHEVAHLAAYARHGTRIRPHGPEWQAIVRELGAEPERCHRFDVSALATRRVRRFDYHCGCRNHRLSSIRHRRVLAGQTYVCSLCAAPLRPGIEPRLGGAGDWGAGAD